MIELIFLPGILLLGIITSYEDLKHGKIRNKWVVLGLLYAVSANAFMYVWVIVQGGIPRTSYFIELASTAMFGLVLGYALWYVGFWTAGDAKLFFAYSALVPLSVYRYGHMQYFDSANILINTFVPFFAFYAAYLLFKSTLRQKIFYARQSLQARQLGALFLFLFAFTWPAGWLFAKTGLPSNYFTNVFMLFLLLVLLERIAGGRLIVIMAVVAGLRIVFDPVAFSYASMLNLLGLFLSFIILRYFILYMGYDHMTKHVDISLLRKGMVPAEAVYLEKGRYKKRPLLHFDLLSYLRQPKKGSCLFDATAEGLTETDVSRLKDLEQSLGFEHLRVYRTIPFAPHIFGGVVLSIMFRGNIFLWLTAVIAT